MRDAAVERSCRRQIFSQPSTEEVGDAATEAETGGADFPVAVRPGFQPMRGRDEIFTHLVAVDFHNSWPPW